MAHIIEDRILETSTSVGTGAFTLSAAVAGFRRFSAVCGVGDTVPYMIEALDSLGVPSGDYEYGIGTYSAANELTRTIVYGSSNSGLAVNFAAGSKNVALALNKQSLLSATVPRGHLYGLTLSNNGSDATNDIDITSGECSDSTGEAMMTGGAMTKRLDAAWAAGTNQGGLDTGSIANGTYHAFAILKDADNTVDYLFSTSPTAPTMPAGYTKFRRIGSFLRESAAIVGFVQFGDTFYRKVPILSVDATNPATAATDRAMNVPTGINVDAILAVHLADNSASGANALLVSSPDTTATAAVAGGIGQAQYPAVAAAGAALASCEVRVMTNTSAQVRTTLQSSDADIFLRMTTIGWVDSRGRSA